MRGVKIIMILMLIYMVIGYMAVPHTIWKNKILIEFELGNLFVQRVIWGTVLG